MNATDFTPLPARPSLHQYKKQSKDFTKLFRAGDSEVVRRAKKSHPRADQFLDSGIPNDEFALADAQLVIAREHGFESWPRFAKHIDGMVRENSPISKFELAADAIVRGDVITLDSLVRKNPDLVRARSTRRHRATLLHYLGANGVEDFRQKSARGAVEAARILLNAGAEVDALADIYGKSTALGLTATSLHPKQAGVQIALMETLLQWGAAIEGVPGLRSPLISALHNGHWEAAEFLAERGAQLDLEGAAGVGRIDVVKSFFNEDGGLKENATKGQMESGFLWACEYGRNNVIDFLLNKGVHLRCQGSTGLTGLHWAVVGGQVETIKLLVQRGAPLEATNVYGGTVLGQAMWSAINGDGRIDYVAVIEMLVRAGAQIQDGSLAWLGQQGGRSSLVREKIAAVLRSYGAQT